MKKKVIPQIIPPMSFVNYLLQSQKLDLAQSDDLIKKEICQIWATTSASEKEHYQKMHLWLCWARQCEGSHLKTCKCVPCKRDRATKLNFRWERQD